MRQILFLVILMIQVLSFTLAHGQDTGWKHPVEFQAEPVIGFKQYIKILSAQIDRAGLPDSAVGKVYIKVTVNIDSTLSEIEIVKSFCEPCNKEALRIISSDSTKWKPSSMNGVQVQSYKAFPILF